ncbi:MAG TPA: DUF962 domain-containing protein [Micromonosporaceae bacterium]|nr:DUF962 domain-containing protein [Micromonosporaceae bacterium]
MSAAPDTDDWPRRPAWFAEYFPRYMAAHTKPGTRWFHVAGTLVGAVLATMAVVRQRPELFALGALALFALAWCGHFGIERNRPAGFRNPVRALPGDLTLTVLMLSGKQKTLDRLSEQGRTPRT